MSEQLTVEEALKELREMFRHVSLMIIECQNPGCISYRYQITPQHVSHLRDPGFHAETLSECMAQVRAWKESQSKESK